VGLRAISFKYPFNQRFPVEVLLAIEGAMEGAVTDDTTEDADDVTYRVAHIK